MFYRFVRAVVSFALRLFYRVTVNAKPIPTEGPVIFVGNHPNGLIDPALVFVITDRQVTFMAKAPLFRTPVIGQILRGLDALPVYRKQDDPTQMNKNEATFEAASNALVAGRAITLFPEGKSHSEPALAELKTGTARIAFRAARQGAKVRIVPVGLTYAEKQRFRSEVLIDIGDTIEVVPFLPASPDGEVAAVRSLTERITHGLRAVTLNLAQWEDLPTIETAEELYAFHLDEKAHDPERVRRFARGMEILREEQPERLRALQSELASLRRRLELVRANPSDLTLVYRRSEIIVFALRNLAAVLFGFPLFALGVVVFAIPFYVIRWLTKAIAAEWDDEATIKFIATLLMTPLWAAALTVPAWHFGGTALGVCVLAGVLPLAVFTRYFYERRKIAVKDVLVFFTLGSRARLKARLLVECERVASEIDALAQELRPRVLAEPAAEAR